MIKTTIKWHKTSEKLPKKSCMVLAITEPWFVHYLEYSYKNKLFNVSDCDNSDDEYAFHNVIYWAYADKFKSQIKEKTVN